MNVENATRARLVAALALCLAAAFPISSCRLGTRGSLSDVGMKGEPTGTELAVSARFVTADDDVSGFFKKLMPDSGITPVRVAIRNDGDATLLIHSANGMDVGTPFEGLSLVAGGTTYLPVHPKDAVALYLVYNEVDIGRYYRPLFGKSIFRALEDGMFEPVRLEPGQERTGYLYFAIPRGARPDSCELVVRASVSSGTPYSLTGSHFTLSRDEFPFFSAEGGEDQSKANISSCDAPYGYLFALAEDAGTPVKGLYLARVRSLDPESDSLWTRMSDVSSKSAAIADATCLGSLAACAVNFKSKSRVYFLQCGEDPRAYGERYFPRGVRHVFLHSGGAFVVTDNGFCHSYSGSSHSWRRGVKLGMDVEETGLYRGRLFAFLKNKEINVFGESESGVLTLVERHSLQERAMSAIGLVGGKLALLNRGEATRGDAISLFDVDSMSQMTMKRLSGKVAAAASDGSSLVVQFEEGTLVRLVPGSGDAFDVAEAGYLPFTARVLKAAPHGFIAIGKTGAFVVGEIGSWSPGASGAVETSVRVR
jgi:hypothetical protein